MKVLAVSTSEKKGVKKENKPEISLKVGFGVEHDAHGGTSGLREVSFLACEAIDLMRQEGTSLNFGDFAENITTQGIDLHLLPLGTRLYIGPTAVLEVSQIGKTCHHGCAIKQTTGSCIMPTHGIFAKVLTSGIVRPDDAIRVDLL
ncbi:MAG: MOSC domain-containing protein [Candidatus Adiutrix sp.]